MSSDPTPAQELSFAVRPIGFVRNDIDSLNAHGWDKVVSDVVIDSRLEAGLEGIEAFSHVVVLFWMHRLPAGEPVPLKVHPQRRADLPLVGLFATRAPTRPNPIGVACVRLLERKENVLKVINLDAINGTPVIDIKAYMPGSDAVPDAMVADWVRRLNCGQ